MELRVVKMVGNTTPAKATTDLTLRRVQKLPISRKAEYEWSMISNGKELQSGQAQADENGILTITELTITVSPSQLKIVPADRRAEQKNAPDRK